MSNVQMEAQGAGGGGQRMYRLFLALPSILDIPDQAKSYGGGFARRTMA